MAVSITPKIYIEGISYTPYLVTPVKWGNFLDEQLDEAYITLVSVPFKDLAPLTVVDLIFRNKMYFGNIKNPQVLKTYPDYHKRMIVANDSAEEYPVGSGRYTHNIYLIEETKRLEMYIVDSLTFTNSTGRGYYLDTLARYTLNGTGTKYINAEQNAEMFKALGVYGSGYNFLPPYDIGQLYDNNKPGSELATVNTFYQLTVKNSKNALKNR